MQIKILKPNLHILGKVREVGEVVENPDPNECRNLCADGRAEEAPDAIISPAEEEAQEQKTETQPPAE